MNELSPPVETSLPSATRMSLGRRLMKVFTAPGEVFAEVKRGPDCPANWLVPSFLSCVAGVVAARLLGPSWRAGFVSGRGCFGTELGAVRRCETIVS